VSVCFYFVVLCAGTGYHLCRLSLRVGSPELPISDDLHAAHVFCWKAAVVDFLQKSRVSSLRVGLTVSGLWDSLVISLSPYHLLPFALSITSRLCTMCTLGGLSLLTTAYIRILSTLFEFVSFIFRHFLLVVLCI